MSRTAFCLALLFVAVALVLGCSDDKGSPPVIVDLTYAPASGAVGVQTTVSGQFTFGDPDGDVESYTIALTGPGSLAQTIGPQTLQGSSGVTSGPITLALVLSPTVAGTYSFEVWLTDAAGNDSNHLTGTFVAQ